VHKAKIPADEENPNAKSSLNKEPGVSPLNKGSNPPFEHMVCEAIGDSSEAAISRQAIKKYIQSKYPVRETFFKNHLSKAISKAITEGHVLQVKGRYKLQAEYKKKLMKEQFVLKEPKETKPTIPKKRKMTTNQFSKNISKKVKGVAGDEGALESTSGEAGDAEKAKKRTNSEGTSEDTSEGTSESESEHGAEGDQLAEAGAEKKQSTTQAPAAEDSETAPELEPDQEKQSLSSTDHAAGEKEDSSIADTRKTAESLPNIEGKDLVVQKVGEEPEQTTPVVVDMKL